MIRIVAVLVLIGSLTPLALSQDAPPVSEGLKQITATGQGIDKDSALLDAKRKAVEQAYTQIHWCPEARVAAIVNGSIIARAASFMQDCKVNSTRQVDDDVWEVKITAMVSMHGIQGYWGMVTGKLKDPGPPKIMVFINEKIRNLDNNRDEQVEDSTVQTRIEALLLESGFLLVDRKQIAAVDKKDLESAVAEDNAAKVQAIAKRFGAQLFITGSANATGKAQTINGVAMFAYEGEANVKCYWSDTAQMMSAVPGAATRGVQRVWRAAAMQSLDAQAKVIAPKVRFDILRFWSDEPDGRGEVQLHVEGVSFVQKTKLKAALKALKEVKEVKDVNDEFHTNNAEMRIQTEMNAEKLAERLSEAIKNLAITEVSANRIKAKLKTE